MVTKEEAVRRLVTACPGFSDAWQAHLQWWEGEPAGEYNDLGELAQWIVGRMAEGDVECFSTLFTEVEALLRDASTEIRNLLVIGLLEDIQNVAVNGSLDPDLILPYLGPESRKGWFELIEMWHGPGGAGWPGKKQDS